jgi:hypothetical protein
MHMTKWSGSSKGLIFYENDLFQINFNLEIEDKKFSLNGQKKFANTGFIFILKKRQKGHR